ncbi:helix-turn-helix domain-containing protein [Faecalimonas sp. LCP19S3_D12]
MSKYSFEFKKKVVLAYLNGEGGYGYLSKTYGIPAKRNIEQWVHNYQTFGCKFRPTGVNISLETV